MINFKLTMFGRTFYGWTAVALAICWGYVLGWVAGYIAKLAADAVVEKVKENIAEKEEENGEDENGEGANGEDENGDDENGDDDGSGSFIDPGPNGDDTVLWDVSPGGLDLGRLGGGMGQPSGTGQPLRAAARKQPVTAREGARMSALKAGFGTVLERPGVSPPNQQSAPTTGSQGSLT